MCSVQHLSNQGRPWCLLLTCHALRVQKKMGFSSDPPTPGCADRCHHGIVGWAGAPRGGTGFFLDSDPKASLLWGVEVYTFLQCRDVFALSRVHADLGRHIHVSYAPLLKLPGFLHDCAGEAHCARQHVAQHGPFNRVGFSQLLAPEDEDGREHGTDHKVQEKGWRAVGRVEGNLPSEPCDKRASASRGTASQQDVAARAYMYLHPGRCSRSSRTTSPSGQSSGRKQHARC